MRVGLLLCDFMPDEYAAVAGSYEEMFSNLFSYSYSIFAARS